LQQLFCVARKSCSTQGPFFVSASRTESFSKESDEQAVAQVPPQSIGFLGSY
jgi:hypothetical protein